MRCWSGSRPGAMSTIYLCVYSSFVHNSFNPPRKSVGWNRIVWFPEAHKQLGMFTSQCWCFFPNRTSSAAPDTNFCYPDKLLSPLCSDVFPAERFSAIHQFQNCTGLILSSSYWCIMLWGSEDIPGILIFRKWWSQFEYTFKKSCCQWVRTKTDISW